MIKPNINMIVAVGPDNVIGKGNKLAWRSKIDFYHFVNKTSGWPCIFGATTFYSLPKYPLKNRLNVVLDIESEGTGIVKNDNGSWIVTNDINEAFELIKNYNQVFICGGKSIYKYCLDNDLIDTIYLSEITSPTLEKEIREHPEEFIRFPYTKDEFLKPFVCTQDLTLYYLSQNIKEDGDLSCTVKVYNKEHRMKD